MTIKCNGTAATVIIPARRVRRICAWCKCELGEMEKGAGYMADDTHGICDACALAQLPLHLHDQWREARGMESVGSEPLRVGEMVFEQG